MNSRYALEQLPEVMRKLLARSTEGKVSWREDDEPEVLDRTDMVEAFYAPLEEGLTASIDVSKSEIAFAISSNQQIIPTSLLEIRFARNPPRYGFDSPTEEGAYNSLIELHDIARRIALDLDSKIESVKGYLDKLV